MAGTSQERTAQAEPGQEPDRPALSAEPDTSPGPPAAHKAGDASETPANWRWRTEAVSPGAAVVFDLDGVLSDAANRQHFIKGRRRDWDAFFEACGDDPLIDDVARLLELLDEGLTVVLLTGRPISVQLHTLGWLTRFGLRWDLLVMRDTGDYALARSFKQRSVAELRAFGLDLKLAFEDDRRNLEMFRREGVPCVYVHSGYYD